MFGALDLASGRMAYRFRNRKDWMEFLYFVRQLRRRFPVGNLLEGVGVVFVENPQRLILTRLR